MTTRQALPILPPPPRAPITYSVEYMNQLNRWLTGLQQMLSGPIFLRGTGLYLLLGSLPTSGAGLIAGEVFSNDGILTVVREGDMWLDPIEAVAEIGSVTVTV